MANLSDLKHVHIIGVGGTLMGAFAGWLKRKGIRVTGSDQNMYPPMSDVLTAAGVETLTPYAAENITRNNFKPSLIVVGNVIRKDNPEAMAAQASGIETTSLPAFMEKWLLPSTRNIVIAGTHGKTTTSSLMAFILHQLKNKPSYFVGGVGHDLPHSFHVDDAGKYFVLEGDEYDTVYWDKVPKFFHYLPDDAVLTSVEFDHADIYADLAAVVKAFEGLVTRIRRGGRLILCTDFEKSAHMRAFASKNRPELEVVTYGLKNQADFQAANFRQVTESGQTYTAFEVVQNGKAIADLRLQLPGAHNVANALAVWIECSRLGLPEADVARAMKEFRGVKRRQEERGEVGGVLVIDDFAHHPTAVRETLAALRARYPERRLIAVFEPRSATSRRKVFQQEYAEAFRAAHAVFIAKPYDQSRIDPTQQFSSDALIADLRENGCEAHGFAEVEAGVAEVAAYSKKGDLVAVLSNGGFGGYISKLLLRLK